MARMLFVCTGNICRSPYAERYSAHAQRLGVLSGWEYASAGLAARVDEPMEARMARELAAHGGDPAGFAARQLGAADVREADLVLVMEARQREQVLRDHPAVVRRTFTLGQLADLARSLPRLRGGALIEEAGQQRQAAREDDDVQDPYGHGGRMAIRTSLRITELLDDLLPRLTLA